MPNGRSYRIFGTRAGAHIARAVCAKLDVSFDESSPLVFYDREIECAIESSVAGQHAFVIGSTEWPFENTLELAGLVDAIRRGRPESITVVLAYAGYMRGTIRKEDRRNAVMLPLARAPIVAARPDRFMVLDPHNRGAWSSVEGIDAVHLFSSVFAVRGLQHAFSKPFRVASIYSGNDGMAKRYASLLGWSHLPDLSYLQAGESVLTVDAILDDPRPPLEFAKRAKTAGADEVAHYFVHALLSKKSARSLADGPADRIFVSDSTMQATDIFGLCPKILVFSCRTLIAEAIRRVHNGESMTYDALANCLNITY